MATTYTLISNNTLGSAASSVTFSNIPQTYTDLVLLASVRTTNTGGTSATGMQVNGNSSSIYSKTDMQGNGTSPSSSYTTNYTYANAFNANGTAFSSSVWTSIEIYIPNYTSSNNKPFSSFMAAENNASSNVLRATALLSRTTSAITSIYLYDLNSSNYVSGSSFYLYGIKNS